MMDSASPLISIQHISHRYGEGETAFTALHDISLEVHAGELLLLMGPSGSGKTTLIQIMGSLLRPTEGQIYLGDTDITMYPESARSKLRRENFGFIFQASNLFPTLTATENVMVVPDLAGVDMATARQQSRELLTMVGLGKRLDAFPAELSGGQKQRVGIARALAGNPKIMFADEPTAALDADSGHRVIELLRDLAHLDSRAVVIVTHDSRILNIADRVIYLEDGRVMANETSH